MSLLSSSLARSHGVLLSRLLWPTGILLAATLAMVLGAFGWTIRIADSVSIDGQRARLEASLAHHLEETRERFNALLAVGTGEWGEPARERAPSPVISEAARRLGFDGLARLSVLGHDWLGEGAAPGELDVVAQLLRPGIGLRRTEAGSDELDPGLGGGIRARLLSDGEHHFELVTVSAGELPSGSFGTLDPSDTILAWKRFDLSELIAAQPLHGLHGIRLVRADASDAALGAPLLDGAGNTVAAITWAAYKPGDMLLGRLKPTMAMCLIIALLLFGGVALHFHQTTRNLAETEAVSKELLGRDPLSGLPNRLLFNERLDHELDCLAGKEGGLAVMFIDLDRFKDVNDTYGHKAGDDLIRSVADRLSELLGQGDTLARLGGDEFAIIQRKVASIDDVEALARCILDALTIPFHIANSQVAIGASLGIALAPEHAGDRESLMKLADTALYQAKSEGRNRRSIFQARMDETVRMRKVVEDDLKRAIETDELVLHYQPLYSSDGETIVGLEALIRWPHPEKGLISPSEFIPIAEEQGLVIPLGEWVLRRACRDGNRWPSLRVAVNVSPIQFRHRNFVDTVVRVLAETGFDPSRLELELTEGVVVGDEDAAEAAMVDLRALGVHLALDDFGTGYSSLIYLRRFAFDKIKIDRSFLESMEATGESAILVHSIVHLGRALGLVVTAEGVETREQHRFLQALGCHQLQGYLFSRPVAREQIDRLLGLNAPEETATAA